jgi:HK97 family phage portal protein
MGLFDYFKKSNAIAGSINNLQIFDWIKSGIDQSTSAQSGYSAYQFNSDIGLCVDLIASEFASIKPIVVDDLGNIVDNFDQNIKRFFNNPNPIDSYVDFALNLASNYLLNKNAFILVDGLVTQSPKSIFVVPNTKINITEKTNRLEYNINTTGAFAFMQSSLALRTYDEKQEFLGRIIEERTKLKELYQVRGFYQNSNTILSPSYISSLNRNLEVIDQSMVKLVTKLKKGFSSDELINIDTDDQEAFERFRQDIKNYYSGAGNTGSALIARGQKVDVKSITPSNRDMQTLENKRDSKNAIYQRYKIPQPLIDQQSQTYNNYQTALYSLYDSAVLPLAKTIFAQYTKIFKDRNLLKESQHITYDKNSIDALQLRQNEEIKILKDIGVLTINELRAKAGYEQIEGGDSIYQPATNLPIGVDQYTDDNLETPKKKFYEDLENSGFDKSEIDKYWDEHKNIIKGH